MLINPVNPVTPRVLVVDDNLLNRKKLTRAVVNLGYKADAVDGGKAAFAALEQARYDAILLDILMPEISGFDVLNVIKKDPALSDIPVIVISALGDETASVVKAIELGAEDFLQKDFDLIILKARLSACLTKKTARDQEKQYYQQIEQLTQAAGKLESGVFNPDKLALDEIAKQDSPLGRLAVVFRGMAGEIFERELKAKQTINLLKASLMVIFMGVISGLLPAFARMASNLGANSLGLGVWISAGGGLVFLSIAAYRGNLPRLGCSTIAFLIGWAVIDGVIHRTTILIASAHVEASMLSLIMATQGFMGFGLAAMLRMEQASTKRLVGLAIGMLGVSIALGGRLDHSSSSQLIWFLFAMIPAFFLAVEAIFIAKYKPQHIDDFAALGLMMVITALIIAPVAAARGELITLSWRIGQLEMLIAALILIAIGINVFALQIIKTAGPVFYGQNAYVRTIAGVIWGMLLLHEELSVSVWVALVVIIVGMYLVNPKSDDKELVINRNFDLNKAS